MASHGTTARRVSAAGPAPPDCRRVARDKSPEEHGYVVLGAPIGHPDPAQRRVTAAPRIPRLAGPARSTGQPGPTACRSSRPDGPGSRASCLRRVQTPCVGAGAGRAGGPRFDRQRFGGSITRRELANSSNSYFRECRRLPTMEPRHQCLRSKGIVEGATGGIERNVLSTGYVEQLWKSTDFCCYHTHSIRAFILLSSSNSIPFVSSRAVIQYEEIKARDV